MADYVPPLRHSALRAAAVIPTRSYRTVLVRQRDDDDEADHNKSDHISIKSIKVFSVEVDTHRTILLFAGASLKIRPGFVHSNSAISDAAARQQCAEHCSTVRCAALA